MPFESTSYPRGLSSLLGLKERASNPNMVSDTVSPVVDVTDGYLLTLLEYVATNLSQAAPAVGLNDWSTQYVVPTGELWWVWGYTVSGTCGAGQAIDLRPVVKLGGNTLALMLGSYVAAAANQEARETARNFWAPPGSVFAFHVRSVTGAPVVAGGLVITRLRV